MLQSFFFFFAKHNINQGMLIDRITNTEMDMHKVNAHTTEFTISHCKIGIPVFIISCEVK